MTYTVFVDDNYHYMDKDARYTHGQFDTLEAAVSAAKEIVDDELVSNYRPGMSAADLYRRYQMFGKDTWIAGPGDNDFSAWKYAEQGCATICAA